MTATRELELDTADDPSALLAFARSRRAAADRAEAELLAAAARWAAMHPGDYVITEADWDAIGNERSLPLAGPGTPDVAEFCIAEFALAIGLSTDAGRRYLGDAIEIHHRLPRVNDLVQAGKLPAWRARRIAAATKALPAAAAEFVDRHVAAVAHKIGLAALDRLINEALTRYDLEAADAKAEAAREHRGVDVHVQEANIDGTVDISGVLDLPDAVDLEDALTRGAAQLKADGSNESLSIRRAMALGLLARGQLGLDPASTQRPDRRITLHVHATDEALQSGSGLVRVEETRGFVGIGRLAAWCAEPGTQIDVKPVIDLNDHIHTEAYEVPDRLAEQASLRDHTCVFPGCTRPARRCDKDHRVPYDQGGATCSCNIAPLCRGHHRLKTHGGWTYQLLQPGTYLWRSPHGYTYLRDHQGTLDVTTPNRSDRSPPDNGCQHSHPPGGP
jgi:hypothetical protein